MIARYAHCLYSLLLCALCAVPFVAQILAFLGIYTPLSAISLTIVAFLAGLWLYWRTGQTWQGTLRHTERPSTLTRASLAVVIALLLGVFVVRLAAWPTSDLGAALQDDAVAYHLPKAIELYRTGSFWDLTITYGQYPIGYESYAAFSLALRGDLHLLGGFHALLAVLFYLTLYLLLRRYTSLPDAVLLLAALAILFVPFVYSQVLLVGKNDLLLSVALLAAVLHAPLSPRRADVAMHPLALAYATLLAMSVKASGVYVLAFLWLLVLWQMWRTYRTKGADLHAVAALPLSALIIAPAGLWLVRNWLLMGSVFSPEIASFFGGSIAANLGNPLLYSAGDETLAFLLVNAGVVGALVLLMVLPGWSWRVAALLLVCWLTFFVTPLSAFHTPQSTTPHIEWRYTLHTVIFLLLLALVLLQTPLHHLYRWVVARRTLYRLGIAGLLLVCTLLLWRFDLPARLNKPPQLYAPDANEPLYRFVRENTQGTVFYAGFQPFYLYAADYSQRFTPGAVHPLGAADAVAHPTWDEIDYAVLTEQRYQATVARWQQGWQPIYADAQGRVFRRQPVPT